MSIKHIAEAVVTANRTHTEAALLDAHYAQDAVSVEAVDHGEGREARGLEAIRGKHAWWEANMEMTSGTTSEPMFHGDDRFALIFEATGRNKATGETFEMKEVAVYTVAEGKIVREEFFY